MPASISDYLQKPNASGLAQINVGTWVQLVNNVTTTAYVSTAVTDANGKFTVNNVPAGIYTVNTGPTSGGPWTATGDANYVVGPDLRWFNVVDYGADPTGVASSTTAFANAISALNTAGGGVLLLPSGIYSGTITVNVNVRVAIYGWGAILRPPASNDGVFVSQANGSGAQGCEIYGLVVDGQSLASTNGVHARDTDRMLMRNCRIVNCTSNGVLVESFTSARWAENNAFHDTFITNCGTGLAFSSPGGTHSLGETHIWNVGISGCATGISLNSPSTFYRCRLMGVTIWLPTNGTGLVIDCDVRDSVFIVDFENLNGTQTGLTGVNVTTNAANVDVLDAHLAFTGTFATTVSDATAKGLVWSEGTHRFTTIAGNGFWGAMKVLGDTADRVRFAGQFAAGGGMQFGNGTAIDVNLYRVAAATLKTDGAFARSRQTPTETVLVSGVDATLGEQVDVTLTAARLVGAPLNPQTGDYLTFTFTQGGAGGFAVTWNAVFKVTWADTGNTTGKIAAITFRYNGTNWTQVGAQAPYV